MAELEVWEAQTGGRVWVETTLDPAKGTTKMRSVVGKGNRIRLSTDDRKLAQERCREKKNDPFTNGLLLRVDADQQEDELTKSPSALSDDDLKKLFKIKQVARFTNAIDDLSEVSLRRLIALSDGEETVSVMQHDKMKEILNSKYGPNRDKDPSLRDLGPEELAEKLPIMKLSG